MVKSRLAAFAAIALFHCAAGAAPPDLQPPPTAEDAIRRQRDGLLEAAGIGCRRGGEDIVVCAPGGGARPVFPEEPGARRQLVAGEAPVARSAADLGGCCAARRGLDVLRIGTVVAKGLGRIF